MIGLRLHVLRANYGLLAAAHGDDELGDFSHRSVSSLYFHMRKPRELFQQSFDHGPDWEPDQSTLTLWLDAEPFGSLD